MTRWLLDTSALGQRGHPDVAATLSRCIQEGAAVCDMVVAESLVRATSTDDLQARRQFFDAIEVLPVDATTWEVVGDLAEQLAESGEIVATGDVVIAACARSHEIVVIHYDTDYDILGRTCGIEHDWVVPRGRLDPGRDD